MKAKNKLIISLIWLVGILALLGLWVYSAKEPFGPIGYVIFGLVVLMVGFSLYFKIKSFKNEKAGLAPEDELSKKIKEKAAAKAFQFSIFMWAFGILFLVDIGPGAKIIMGLGVMGMMLVFLIAWLYLSKVGISNDNTD